MQKKYTTLKTLAAFTALASSTIPLYSQAQVKTLPSIELNFDVLQKLKHNEEKDIAVKNEKKLAPELNDSQRIVAPTPKPEIVQTVKEEAPKTEPLPEPEQVEHLPIIIKKDSAPEEAPIEQDSKVQPEEKKSVFSGIGNFFSKVPFFSNKTENPATPEAANSEIAAQADTASDKIAEDANKTPKAEKQKEKKPTVKKPVKKKKAEKKTKKPAKAKNPPKPHLKHEENVVASKKTLPAELETKTEKPITNEAPVIPAPQEKPDIITPPAAEEKKQEIIVTAPKEEVKKAEPEVVAPEAEEPKKDEAISNNMWEKFLDNAKSKANTEENEINQNSMVSNKADALPKDSAPEPKTEPSTTQKAETAAEPVEKPAEIHEEPKVIAPVVTPQVSKKTEAANTSSRAIESNELEPETKKEAAKPESSLFSSFMESLPSFSKKPAAADADKNKTSAVSSIEKPSSSLEDKLAESKKIIAEKSNDIKPAEPAAIPPVPETASIPLEIKNIAAPANADITIQEPEKAKDKAKGQSDILLSVTFAGNSTDISDADKEKINNLVKQLSTSSKRIKVMSYAQGTDGEVNSSRRISLQRAIAIRMQMIQDGLEKTRINVQAVGNNTTNQEFSNSANIYVVE